MREAPSSHPMSRLLNLLRACRELKKAQRMSRADVLRLQEQRWRALARYALQVSPFYRRHLAGIDVERCALSDIPPMTKRLLRDNWDEIVPDSRLHYAELQRFLKDPANWGTVKDGRWLVASTSGTTTEPLMVVHDIAAVDYSHACQNVRNSASPHSAAMPGLPFFRKRMKVLAIVMTKAPSVSSALLHTRPWVGSLFCTYHKINAAAPWSEILAEVQRLQPDALMGFSSVFGRLAQAQLSGELDLHLSPERGYIWAGGDAVTPGIRELCRQAFGVEPSSMYGCGEVLSIARQWRGLQHLCCHDDMMVLETVDEAGRPVAEGELSDHAYVTPLINKAVPLLRYRVNDRLRPGPVHEHWPFRTLTEIHGRSTMTYYFRTPETKAFFGNSLRFAIDDRSDVLLYQFRQTAPAAIECLLVPRPGADASVLCREIEDLMRQRLDGCECQAVQCTARIVPELLPDPRTGKVEQQVPLRDELTA